MDFSWNIILWAFFGGIAPALLWLWFWLREDMKHPEPRRLIAAMFAFGMLAVPLALLLERAINEIVSSTFILVALWSGVEELLKYAGAYIVSFRGVCLDRSRCLDEPIDPIIYMITAALGFAAIENALFLLSPLAAGDTALGIITGNLRFIGAMVLHVIASASIGVAMAFSFYKTDMHKKIYLTIGLCTAIALHALFNLSIIITKGENILITFGILWVAAIVLLWMFERVKRMESL